MSRSARSASLLRRVARSRPARWSLVVICLLVLAALVGPRLWPYSPSAQLDIVRLKNAAPSWSHPLGTDQYSRDLLARILSGAQISLGISTVAVALSMTLGTMYGLVAGYAGGRVDTVMMRALDGLLAIPRVLLVIALVTVWTQVPLWGLIVLIGGTGWFGVSRLVRAETLTARRAVYVDAARALGVTPARILWRHVLPNVLAPVIVSATLAVGNVIVLESGLSYLGAGTREPSASWGAMFTDAMSSSLGTWGLLFPGIAIVVTAMAFNVLGDALRDILDPRTTSPVA